MSGKWWGWGEVDVRYPEEALPPILDYLATRGLRLEPPRGPPEPPPLPATRLTSGDLEALKAVLEVRFDDEDRLVHSLGKGYMDLLRARTGAVDRYTDAVAYPQAPREVMGLLRIAADRGFAVIPFGGGTSVLGGVSPIQGSHRAAVTVDLRHLDRILEVDRESDLARVEAGVAGPNLEAALERYGLTLGHYPQSFHYSTVGGWIATRSSGHASGKYRRLEDSVRGLTVVTPAGRLVTREAPARSTGPELKELFLGSEGRLGIVVEAVLRVYPRPEAKAARGLLLPSFTQALDRARSMVQADIRPASLRVSNAEETRALFAARGIESEESRSFVLLEFAGSAERVPEEMERAVHLWTAGRVLDLGAEAAAGWEEEYFRAPYLRDELLDRGLLVETLETATSWSHLETLYAGVKEAVEEVYEAEGAGGLVLCHLSHAYRDGASLYFTLLTPRASGREMAQWSALKEAATKRLLELGGTLSHHHGIGIDHRGWMEREHGLVGVQALQALKASLDPRGLMNPGKVWEGKG